MTTEPEGTSSKNISTEHQEEGDAARPADTLDRPREEVHPARDFQPGRDEGKAEPGD